MRTRSGRLLRNLGRVSGPSLVRLLVDHLEVDREGVSLARSVLEQATPARQATKMMSDIEHRGDLLRAALARDLSKALVTPIDREDFFRLSRGIDDVLDNLRDFVREWTIYGPVSSAFLTPVLDAIAEALISLEAAVESITGPTSGIAPNGLAAKRTCNRVRREYESQLGLLFQMELTMEVMKLRELLRRLDVVGLRLDEAVDVLLDAAVKRGS